MEFSAWDVISAIVGVLSFLLTLIIEWNKLEKVWQRVAVAILTGILAFSIIKIVPSLISPGPRPPENEFYDDFNSADYEGNFDTTLWINNSPDSCQIYQQNGALIFTNQTSLSKVDCILTVGYPSKVNIDGIRIFEAQIKLDDDQVGDNNQGLYITTDDGVAWRAFCGITSNSQRAEALFDVNGDGYSDIYQTISAQYNRWYKISLRINPDNMMVSCYADNKLVGSIIPRKAEELREASFQLHLDAWRPENSKGTSRVDDVTRIP